jgi:NADP-dependent 3-hydroxy acid dehydrogenase YdfG
VIKKAVSESIASLPEAFSTIDILINNAGNAHGLDPIQNGDLDDWDAMIDINVKGLLYVSKAIIPQMIEIRSYYQHRFHCCKSLSNGNVYCATKHAVDLNQNAYGFKPVRN